MSEMFSQLIRIMKRFLLRLINFDRILNILAKLKSRKTIKLLILLLKKFRHSIDILDKINWKNVVKVFTIPFMLFQIWNLTEDYLKYPIDVSVEWFALRDSLNRLSNDSIPAITVCYEHIFERILFDKEVKESFRYNLNLTNYTHFYHLELKYTLPDNIKYLNDSYLKKLINHYYFNLMAFLWEVPENIRETILYYLNVNNRTEFIERQLQLNDKTANDFNGVQRQLDFFRYTITCRFGNSKELKERDEECGDKFRNDLTILSPFGKCHTFLSEFKQYSNEIQFKFDHDLVFILGESRKSEVGHQHIRYFKRIIFIHPPKELPKLTTNEFLLTDSSVYQFNGFTIVYNRVDFEKLPKPYATNCRYYGRSNQFECLNECYLNGYNQKWNCTPNDNHLLTVVLKNNSVEPKVKFCHKTNNETKVFNKNLRHHCLDNCLEPCEYTQFFTAIQMDIHSFAYFQSNEPFVNIKFFTNDKFYSKIIFSPRITFIDLIISITNIMSLCHGISFLSIFTLLFLTMVNILLKFKTGFESNTSTPISTAMTLFQVFI